MAVHISDTLYSFELYWRAASASTHGIGRARRPGTHAKRVLLTSSRTHVGQHTTQARPPHTGRPTRIDLAGGPHIRHIRRVTMRISCWHLYHQSASLWPDWEFSRYTQAAAASVGASVGSASVDALSVDASPAGSVPADASSVATASAVPAASALSSPEAASSAS